MKIVYDTKIEECLWTYWGFSTWHHPVQTWTFVSPYRHFEEYEEYEEKDSIRKINNALFIAGIVEIV